MRSLLRESEHLVRMGALFVVGTGLFLVVRALLMPDDFGLYGHYRPGALEENASQPLGYAGAEACEQCHVEAVSSRAGGAHERVRCEACHGALAGHAEDPTADPIELPGQMTLCTGCHARVVARPAWFPQVDPEEHAMGEDCKSCHEPHDPGM